jgi:hypothetical protein
MAVGIRLSVPVTCGMLAAWGVVSETPGARGAGAGVGFAARFGVGTTMMALPPTPGEVGFATGWAAPPPTAGRRGGTGVGLACAAGDGEATGFETGPSLAAGGGAGAVQPSITPSTSRQAAIRRRSGPEDTR